MISVIIPHKPERNFNQTIHSINEQTYKDIEIIVIYDYYKKGAAYCRNRGAEKTSGSYLFFCDDDVVLEPNCLEKMLNVLEGNIEDDYVNFVYCDYNRKGNITGRVKGEPYNYETLKDHNYISTMSLIRKMVFIGYEFDRELTRFQDWELWLRLGKNGHKGIYIPEVLFTAHYDDKGITNLSVDEYYKHKNIIMRKNFNQ